MAVVRRRIEKVLSELKESDIQAEGLDLIARSPEEFLLLQRLREIKLKEAKEKVKKLLCPDIEAPAIPPPPQYQVAQQKQPQQQKEDPSCHVHAAPDAGEKKQ